MKIWLIRHSMTQGNAEKRYVGVTDEPLCQQGILLAKKLTPPLLEEPSAVYVSPLLRCRQTAEILFPHKQPTIHHKLRECDFGVFENRNYEELKDTAEYAQWLKSGGEMCFPKGENKQEFSLRCAEGFAEMVEGLMEKGIRTAAAVVHGGTIMAVLEAFSEEKQPFYHWQVENCGGYELDISDDWHKNKKVRIGRRLDGEERS